MRVVLVLPWLLLATAGQAARPPHALCPVVLEQQHADLEDARLAVDLARSRIAAFEKIFGLIDGLYENDAIDRMTWLRARHDRDSARLQLERAGLLLTRQQALAEQYRLFCEAPGGEIEAERTSEIESVHDRYRRIHCDQQAKAIEIAQIDLAFARAWLDSVRELREGEVATRQEVILAELDVELEEKRLTDARRRTAACRESLAKPVREPRPPATDPDGPR